jgi:pyrroline-5-carboxylate reductase
MITIIGFGSMGQSLAHGWKSNHPITVIHKQKTVTEFNDVIGIDQITPSKQALFILAIKPKDMDQACQALKKHLQPAHWVISVAAGISLDYLKNKLSHSRVIRSMPNLAVKDKKGLTALYNPSIPPQEQTYIQSLWNNVGECFWVNLENDFHLFTAVVGSGPAYFIAFASTLEKTITELGLDNKTAEKWSKAALHAASSLGKNSSLECIINRIQSPGGTTEAALDQWQDPQMHKMLKSMVQAAENKSLDLTK